MDFYLIKMKRLADARNILTRLNFLFHNSYFNQILKKYLISTINNDDTEIEYSNASELLIRKKNSCEVFHLIIKEDNTIEITVNNNLETIKMELNVDNEEDRINFNKEITVPNKTRSLAEKTIERKIYIDNKLRYKYIYTSFEDLSSCNHEYITVSESYIDLDGCAVIQKTVLSGERDKQKDMQLDYFKTNSIAAPPFNNLVDHQTSRSEELIPTSKDVFYDFINGNNNIAPIL